ncbi:hypothetical protein HHI36_008069 [Cryptolaemus montrouzieri]|uniref:Uncharacterized protein n=1 Tax=Cryptolaemus montrouzieri TaxID=559131 RepID=A0ABD2MRG6_9CUCU
MQEESDPAYSYRGPSGALKVIRGRGCEESFRAAVDDRIIDPNHRSEVSAKKHWLLDPPTVGDMEMEGFSNVRGGPRQSSLNAALDSKHRVLKKKSGILKGIGSMFRFGKHRKMELTHIDAHYHHRNEFDTAHQSLNSEQPEEYTSHSQLNDSHQSRKTHEQKEEQDKNLQSQHQHHLRLQQQGITQLNHKESSQPLYQRHGFVHRHAEQVQVIPENSVPPSLKYRNTNGEVQRRSDRKMHEQRQTIRHSYYSSEDRENLYDHRQAAFGEYGRPGSRTAVIDSVPFTHYVNYNELQAHLSNLKEPLSDSQIVQMRLQVQQQRLKVEEESRKQHQYHSQRQTKVDNQLRPVSNFYEYESVQSILNSRVKGTAPPNYVKQPSSPMYHEVNSNSLPRNQGLSNPQNRGSQRGPFVTQVTIGENGTKV